MAGVVVRAGVAGPPPGQRPPILPLILQEGAESARYAQVLRIALAG